ncbi:MAG: hypothetical protein ACRYGK_18320, partial [Janthinobacterium lividum]
FADTSGDGNAELKIVVAGLQRSLVQSDFAGVELAPAVPQPSNFTVDDNAFKHVFSPEEFGFAELDPADHARYKVIVGPLESGRNGTLRYGDDATLIRSSTTLSVDQLDTLVYTEAPYLIGGKNNGFQYQVVDAVTNEAISTLQTEVTLQLQQFGQVIVKDGPYTGSYKVLVQASMRDVPDMPYAAILDNPGAGNQADVIDNGDLLYVGAGIGNIGASLPTAFDTAFVQPIRNLADAYSGDVKVGALNYHFEFGSSRTYEFIRITDTSDLNGSSRIWDLDDGRGNSGLTDFLTVTRTGSPETDSTYAKAIDAIYRQSQSVYSENPFEDHDGAWLDVYYFM